MAQEYRYITADTHLDVSPERWRHRVAEQYRDRAPRLVRLPQGDAMLVENSPLRLRTNDVADVPSDQWWRPGTGVRYGESVGTGSPEQRLRELDTDEIDAEIEYIDNPLQTFWNRITDDDAYHAVIRGYNDWLAEEHCAVAPDRLIGVGILPQRDLEHTIAEVEHCARLGLKAVDLNAYPSGHVAAPTPEDDRFWAAALDLDMAVTVHSSFGGYREAGGAGPDLGRLISAGYGHEGAIGIAAQLAVAGVFDRFPKLQLYFAETGIGWIPSWFEQMDILYQQHRYYHERMQGLQPLSRLPSEIVREHCLWGFIDEPVGVQLRHYIGVDTIMWSNDFPHQRTDWPHSMEVIERNFQGVPEDEKHLMLAGNCVRFFHLDGRG